MPKGKSAPSPSEPPRVSTVARAKAFLAAYRRTCNITASATAAGIQPRQHYRWLEKYPKYKAAFERAQIVAAGFLEACAIQRATIGWEEPVFYQGELVREKIYSRNGKKFIGYGKPLTITRFDGGLMQFLLRGALPEKYNRTAIEHSGPGGKPIDSKLEIVFVKPAAPEGDSADTEDES
jgi:hypothetical protein